MTLLRRRGGHHIPLVQRWRPPASGSLAACQPLRREVAARFVVHKWLLRHVDRQRISARPFVLLDPEHGHSLTN